MEDTADIFDDSLMTLFSVPPIGFSTSSPSDPWVYTPPEDAHSALSTASVPSVPSAPSPSLAPIKLWLPQPPASVFAALQANNLWLSAVYLSDRIARGEVTFSDAPILELGAGAGLPSIMAARMGYAVCCTDYDDASVVGTIRRNLAENLGGVEVGAKAAAEAEHTGKCAREGSGPWAVRGHTWGTDTSELVSLVPRLTSASAGGFDLILADTLWTSAGHDALLVSIMALLRRGGTAHVTAGLHTGRGPVNRFMAAAAARGLKVLKHGEVRWLPGGGWGVYEDEENEGEGEVRGVVVYYTLHRE